MDSRDGGTTRAGVDAERRRRRVPRSATRRKLLAGDNALFAVHFVSYMSLVNLARRLYFGVYCISFFVCFFSLSLADE